MERRFEGRTFMVTGAGTGFGAALAARAAQEGAARVLIHYRSSADGALVRDASGICGRPALSLRQRATRYTIVFGTSAITARPPDMSPYSVQ